MFIKKWLILLLMLVSIGYCYGQNRNVVIQGIFTNATDAQVSLSTIADEPVFASTIRNGTFSINKGLKEGYYLLRLNDAEITTYLVPGDVFTIKANANNFLNTITFYGVDPFRNNYLITKQRAKRKLLANQKQFYAGDPEIFLKRVNNFYNGLTTVLSKSYALYRFKNIEAKAIQYERLYRLQQYARVHAYYFNSSGKIPGIFEKELSILGLDNEQLFNTFPFYRDIVLSYWKQRIAETSSSLEMIDTYNDIYSKKIKLQLLPSFYQSMIEHPRRAYDYQSLIISSTDDKNLLSAAQQITAVYDSIQPGMPSVPFTYKTKRGWPVDSKELKGYYTLIDIWTSPCITCIQEQDALNRVAQEYPQLNMVSISLDTKATTPLWKQLIASSYYRRIHLIADKSFDSEPIKKYGVASLPRYILIDPKGIIVTPYADKPSSSSFKELLDSLLNPLEDE